MNYDYKALGEQGYTGTVNDRVFKYLGDQGYTGSLNDRKYKYLGDNGFTGSLRDRLKQAADLAGYSSVHNYVYDLGEVAGYTPISMFESNETGFWYDPSDLTTLYQDSTGTTPVTGVEQPVGLMLDKSQGATLGAELVTNGAFNTDSNWVKDSGITISSGVANFATSSNQSIYQNIALTSGKTYIVDFDIVTSTSGASLVVYHSSQTTTISSSVGPKRVVFVADTSQYSWIRFQGVFNVGFTGTIDNISVKEIAGHHATQATSAARPVLRSRYNLLTFTEQFDNAAWTKTNLTVTANAATAPDGTLTADKLIGTTDNLFHNVRVITSETAGTSYTLSCYGKKGEKSLLALGAYSTGTNLVTALFNLETGAIQRSAYESGNLVASQSSTIEDVGNGFYRCTLTYVATFSQNTSKFISVTENTSSITDVAQYAYTGDGTSGIYIWGASLVESQYDHLPYQRVGNTASVASDYDSDFSKFPAYLDFDGVDDYMKVNGLSSAATPITAHFGYVTDDGESTNYKILCDIQTGRATLYGVAEGIGSIGYFDTAHTYSNSDTEDLSVATFNLNSTAGEVRVNGTRLIEGTGQWTESAIGGNVALCSTNGGTAGFINGKLYQAILRSATSTDAEVNRVEAYINRKMGGSLL